MPVSPANTADAAASSRNFFMKLVPACMLLPRRNRGGVQPELLEQRGRLAALRGSEAGRGVFHRLFVIGERVRDQFPAGRRQVHNARAPVGGIVTALDHAFAFETIDRGGG